MCLYNYKLMEIFARFYNSQGYYTILSFPERIIYRDSYVRQTNINTCRVSEYECLNLNKVILIVV